VIIGEIVFGLGARLRERFDRLREPELLAALSTLSIAIRFLGHELQLQFCFQISVRKCLLGFFFKFFSRDGFFLKHAFQKLLLFFFFFFFFLFSFFFSFLFFSFFSFFFFFFFFMPQREKNSNREFTNCFCYI
jgi:hypothetical protein